MKIYFAGSIRGGRNDSELYAQIIETLKEFGEVLTEHIGDKTLSDLGEDGPTDKYIFDRDIRFLKKCDVLVAEVTTPSLGVGYEIAKAEEWGKRVLCLFREIEGGKKVSTMLTGDANLVVQKYESMNQVKKIVEKFLGK